MHGKSVFRSKFERDINTATLQVGVKYSMRDLVYCDVNYCGENLACCHNRKAKIEDGINEFLSKRYGLEMDLVTC